MLRMYAFSKREGKWLKQSLRRVPAAAELPGFRVVTFNVWFDRYECERRCHAVLDILRQQAPDVIALQEVTPLFLARLLSEPWVRDAYACSRSKLLDARYDVVMLSRLPVSRFVSYPLTTDMGRRLHALEIPTTRGRLVVAGVHLESMRERTPTRLTQIDECIPILSRADFSIWLGDFNSAPSSDEDQRICVAFRDAWDDLDGTPGYTRDTSRNAMLAKVKADRHQRIDRILWRGQGFQPVRIGLLGTAPLPDTDGQVFPSDHFGLSAELEPTPVAALEHAGE
ncbi:MAG TPA: endonuclease/exonuclease/phosphatase family protein [Polyangiales bacterium]